MSKLIDATKMHYYPINSLKEAVEFAAGSNKIFPEEPLITRPVPSSQAKLLGAEGGAEGLWHWAEVSITVDGVHCQRGGMYSSLMVGMKSDYHDEAPHHEDDEGFCCCRPESGQTPSHEDGEICEECWLALGTVVAKGEAHHQLWHRDAIAILKRREALGVSTPG